MNNSVSGLDLGLNTGQGDLIAKQLKDMEDEERRKRMLRMALPGRGLDKSLDLFGFFPSA